MPQLPQLHLFAAVNINQITQLNWGEILLSEKVQQHFLLLQTLNNTFI